MAELDAFDMRILAAVQRRGDLTHAELADIVHLSPTQCARRLQRLKAEGCVRGVVALLDAERLGFSVTAHTSVGLRVHDSRANRAFREFVAGTEEVVGCWSQTGDTDYLLRIIARDLPHLSLLIDQLISVTDGLATLKSSIVLHELKASTELPLGR